VAVFPETKIEEALYAHLNALILVPAKITTGLPVAWPGLHFVPPAAPTPPASGAYLRAIILQAPTDSAALSAGTNHHSGILQVSVFYPENKGIVLAGEVAGEVITWFKRDTVLYREGVKVRINKPPYKSASLPEPSWLQVPVTISYLAHVPNP